MKNLHFSISEDNSTSKLMSQQLFFRKIYLAKTRNMVSDINIISLLEHMYISATLIAFRFKSFNCRTTTKVSIRIEYVKNADHLEIVRNSKLTLKDIPANIRTYFLWKSGLKMILNVTISLFWRWNASCRHTFSYDVFKDTDT